MLASSGRESIPLSVNSSQLDSASSRIWCSTVLMPLARQRPLCRGQSILERLELPRACARVAGPDRGRAGDRTVGLLDAMLERLAVPRLAIQPHGPGGSHFVARPESESYAVARLASAVA